MATNSRKNAENSKEPQSAGGDELHLVHFWGVRGTLPSPGNQTLKYGGHTSCVEVNTASDTGQVKSSIILDAGTGIAKFGDFALRRGDREFHIFLSHMHYDHIMGLTRFAPLFRNDCKVHIYGMAKCGKSLSEIFKKFFSAPFFPIEFDMLPCSRDLKFIELNQYKFIDVNNHKIGIQKLNHPQDAIAFRVWNKSETTSVVYATDHEHGTARDSELISFAHNASVFLYDSTYSELAYPNHIGWGHSTAFQGARIARDADVKAYGLFHHDPFASDEQLETTLLPEARKIFPNSFLCSESSELNLAKLEGIGDSDDTDFHSPSVRPLRTRKLKTG